MEDYLALLIAVPALALIAAVLAPNSWANATVQRFRNLVTWVAGAQCLVASFVAIAFIGGFIPAIKTGLLSLPGSESVGISIYYDGIACLMLTLVSFVGWIICRYSVRYLDGEATQGRYFRWASFTIGSVSLMVVSGNLLMFFGCWVMTSLGLHQLLMHYGHRPAASRAAWTKFTISRLGDAALVLALAIIYSEFNTFQFVDLFAAMQLQSGEASTAMHLAGFFLIAGAITKSAQVPFHTWLPQTMETPTPVSALMHAGIVNAGGYLIIRTSPLVSVSPGALATLAVFGAITACYAAVVMLTQTSVKKSLAYSTIAQMGFMMLQCGLGAFSAAMLHILAHSLYKAHAFLSSGSVISQRANTTGAKVAQEEIQWAKLAALGAIVAAMLGVSLSAFGVSPIAKPGGLLLGGVLCLALTSWLGQVSLAGSKRLLISAIGVSGLLCLLYVGTYAAVDSVIAGSLPANAGFNSGWILPAIFFLGFTGLFFLQAKLPQATRSKWLQAFYVHASNGFYFESFLRRIAATR